MRRLLIVFLLVLLPLRGWATDVMALAHSLPAGKALQSLCPDHAHGHAAPAASKHSTEGDEASHQSAHAHCTACQLPVITRPTPWAIALARPSAPPADPLVAMVELAPRPLIKPPIT